MVLKNISAGWFLSNLLPVPLFITLILCLISYNTVYICTINPVRLTPCSKYPRWRKTRRLEVSVQKRAVDRSGGGRSNASPSPHPVTPFPSWSLDIAFKSVLRIRIRDPGSGIWDPGSVIGCLYDHFPADHWILHLNQCCGSGSGIRDPGWEKVSIRIRDPRSGMNNPDHIFRA